MQTLGVFAEKTNCLIFQSLTDRVVQYQFVPSALVRSIRIDFWPILSTGPL